jgi:hypothetical protein
MSIEFKDLKKFTKDGNILLSGEVVINNTNKSDKISIPPVEDGDCNLIISKEASFYILDLIKKSPVTHTNITLYDQDENIFNKYVSDRKNNNSGNLSYKTDTKMMLKNIKVPTIGKNYLVLDSYLGADACHLEKIRERFIINDYPTQLKGKNLTVFTTKRISDMMVSFPTDVEVITVNTKNPSDLINCVVEYVFGKVFGDTSPFNKFIDFGKNCSTLCCRVDNPEISMICRSGGRVEFSTKKEEVSSNFVIFLKNFSEDFHILMDDELISYSIESCDEKFLALPYVSLYTDFNDVKNKEKANDIMSGNQELIISFMINNPFKSFQNGKTFVDHFMEDIHDNLYNFIYSNFAFNHSKTSFGGIKFTDSLIPKTVKNIHCQQSGGFSSF